MIAGYFRQRPDLAAIHRVKPGMTEAEVVALFGERPSTARPYEFSGSVVIPQPGTPKYWYCDAGIIEVRFDPEGRVIQRCHLSYGFRGRTLRSHLYSLLLPLGLEWLVS